MQSTDMNFIRFVDARTIDISPVHSQEEHVDQNALFQNMVKSFAEAKRLYMRVDKFNSYRYIELSRPIFSMSSESLAVLKSYVLRDRMGWLASTYQESGFDRVREAINSRFLEIFNHDGLAKVAVLAPSYDGDGRSDGDRLRGLHDFEEFIFEGNIRSLYVDCLEQFGELKEDGHPVGEFIFSQPAASTGWATEK